MITFCCTFVDKKGSEGSVVNLTLVCTLDTPLTMVGHGDDGGTTEKREDKHFGQAKQDLLFFSW
jgi:hypothetical protein